MHPSVPTTSTRSTPSDVEGAPFSGWVLSATGWLRRIPNSLVALLARFSIAAVFWNSGQTKIEGLVIDLVNGELQLGWPRLSDSAVALFQDELRLPLPSPAVSSMPRLLAARGFSQRLP